MAARGAVAVHGDSARGLVAGFIADYDTRGDVEQARAWRSVSRLVEALMVEHERPARLH